MYRVWREVLIDGTDPLDHLVAWFVDVCDSQKITGYPSLFLYRDGQLVEKYSAYRAQLPPLLSILPFPPSQLPVSDSLPNCPFSTHGHRLTLLPLGHSSSYPHPSHARIRGRPILRGPNELHHCPGKRLSQAKRGKSRCCRCRRRCWGCVDVYYRSWRSKQRKEGCAHFVSQPRSTDPESEHSFPPVGQPREGFLALSVRERERERR